MDGMGWIILYSCDTMSIRAMLIMTNLIFKAGRPGLEVSSVGLFDRFEADPVSHCNLFRHLVTVNVVAFHLSEDQRRHYSSYDQ